MSDSSSWANQTIWWHVFPLGMTGAPIRPRDPDRAVFESTEDLETVAQTRLPRLFGWLDYMVELGANGLLLAPVFESSSHGYDSLDQFKIDPRLGTEEDFDHLVAACRKRGIRILLDGVFSHVGYFHPELHRALREGRDSDAALLFDIDWDGPNGPEPRVWEGHGGLVRLDHNQQVTQDYVAEVMEYWLAKGIDGWRLDAAYSVPAKFWAEVLPRVRESYPNAWFLGEIIHGEYVEFVEESTVDSTTQYWLWKAVWSSISDRNFFELEWAINQNNELIDHFVPNIFVGNHDVTRIATAVGDIFAVTAAAALFTVPGIPSVYYGDEQGFTGEKTDTPSGDDAVRPAFPDSPADLSPLGATTFNSYKALISLRRNNPWLVTARVQTQELTNTRYRYRVLEQEGSRHLDVTLDLERAPHALITDESGQTLWAQPSP